MNEKFFSHFIAEKNYLSHNKIVQQPFWHKYSFQRVPNPVEKLGKFQGWGSKAQVPSVDGYGYFLELHNDQKITRTDWNAMLCLSLHTKSDRILLNLALFFFL